MKWGWRPGGAMRLGCRCLCDGMGWGRREDWLKWGVGMRTGEIKIEGNKENGLRLGIHNQIVKAI